jgi:hypothetical protein
MRFITATKPTPLTVYNENFSLTPVTYPDVDLTQILVMEKELGRRILDKDDSGILIPVTFETDRIPGFPEALSLSGPIRDNSTVIILRGGGIGDVLMCIPAIRELKNHLPAETRITLATFRSNVSLFENIPGLDSVIAQPLTLARFMEADYYLEFNDHGSYMSSSHMTDFYFTSIGLDHEKAEDKSFSIDIGPLYHGEIAELIKDAGSSYKSTVYLNGLASDVMRDIPEEVLKIFPQRLTDHLFVVPKPYIDRYDYGASGLLSLPNVLCLDTLDSMQGYVTALYTCGSIITTDSSAYHIAAGFDKPCLVLFGPVSPGLRTTYYPGVIALEPGYMGHTCNSPCGKSMFSEFPENKTSGEKRCPEAAFKKSCFSPCLSSYSEKELLHAFGKLIALSNNY